MEKVLSAMLLMLALGAFIHSSQAADNITCYESCAAECDKKSDPKCSNEVCLIWQYKDHNATTQTERGCGDKQTYSWIGKCQTANVTDPLHHHVGAEVCVCDTELCNAEMISLGHVTTGGVAILLISVVIGYLL